MAPSPRRRTRVGRVTHRGRPKVGYPRRHDPGGPTGARQPIHLRRHEMQRHASFVAAGLLALLALSADAHGQ